MLDKFIHRVFRLGTALITFLFFVTTFSLAMHAQPLKPPRRDIILLLDGSRSAAFRYDKANKRGHFAKFLIRFFQSFGPETNAIGVTWFAREMSHTIPLMPAREWSKADLFNVAPPWCPRPENPIARTAEDPCYKTDYVSALRWGSEQLKECNLGNKECYIVVFTDGKLGELGDGDSPDEVKNYLEKLRNKNVHIYSVLFREAISLTVEENRVWNEWTDGVLYGAETRAAEDLYGEILGFLGMDKEFNILRKVNVNGRSKIFIKGLPPNLQDLRLDVLPDREDIRDTYSITPNISIGVTRWWYDIQADEITAEFHGQGLVFYRIVSRTLPVDISVDVWPPRPVVGEPLEIRAFIRAGSRYLGPAALERVWAQLMPGIQSVDLKYQGDGVWSGQLPQAPKGKHEIIVRLEPRGNWPIEPTNIITFSLMPQGCTPKVVWDVYPKEITAGANVRCEANFYRCGKIVAPPDVISASIDFPFGNKKCVLHWDPTYLGWSGTTIITGEGKITATLIANGGLWSDGVYRSSGKFIDIRRPMTLNMPEIPEIRIIPSGLRRAMVGEFITFTVKADNVDILPIPLITTEGTYPFVYTHSVKQRKNEMVIGVKSFDDKPILIQVLGRTPRNIKVFSNAATVIPIRRTLWLKGLLLIALTVVFIIAYKFGERVRQWDKQRKIEQAIDRIINSDKNDKAKEEVSNFIRLLEEWRDYFKSVKHRKLEIIYEGIGKALIEERDSNNSAWIEEFLKEAATGSEVAIYFIIRSMVNYYYQNKLSFYGVINNSYLNALLVHHPGGVQKALKEIGEIDNINKAKEQYETLGVPFFFIEKFAEIFSYCLDYLKTEKISESNRTYGELIEGIMNKLNEMVENVQKEKWKEWVNLQRVGRDSKEELWQQTSQFVKCVKEFKEELKLLLKQELAHEGNYGDYSGDYSKFVDCKGKFYILNRLHKTILESKHPPPDNSEGGSKNK